MYICVEKLVTQDGSVYDKKDQIGEEAYAYLQPEEREHFEYYDSSRYEETE